MSATRRSCRGPLPVLLLAAACGAGESGSSSSFSFIDSEGGVVVETAGVRIEIEAPLRYRYRFASNTPGTTTSASTLEGHPFGVRDGVLFVGPRTFGPVDPGALVRVSSGGILVDGEPRGALPAPLEPAE